MAEPRNYVRYRDDVEIVKPDEEQVINGIIAAMEAEGRITAERYRHAVRTSHAKSHGLLKGELRVLDDLLSFSPAHSLAAFRPLGSLMRARLRTYGALSNSRHARNGKATVEPRSLDEVPD
ncbi:MAG: hypothetical protein JO157_09840 [Acetobacteraceae bacterium]|nr:hypothetical protein [Acetobacteraceae bacterium]